jgi:hypothetical protein
MWIYPPPPPINGLATALPLWSDMSHKMTARGAVGALGNLWLRSRFASFGILLSSHQCSHLHVTGYNIVIACTRLPSLTKEMNCIT